MHYRQTGRSPADRAVSNKRDLFALASTGRPPGLVGYLEGDPVGWISLGPRADFLRLQRSPVMKPVDDAPVWSLVCSYVAKPHRGHGIQRRLLAAAIDFARASGATILEVYPVDKPERSHDDFMFFGSRSLYEAAGFKYVERRSQTRGVMRLDL
jgi:GNAT superfamily N-acetyltransferase